MLGILGGYSIPNSCNRLEKATIRRLLIPGGILWNFTPAALMKGALIAISTVSYSTAFIGQHGVSAS